MKLNFKDYLKILKNIEDDIGKISSSGVDDDERFVKYEMYTMCIRYFVLLQVYRDLCLKKIVIYPTSNCEVINTDFHF